jgi:hypothetical protein
MFPYIAQVHRTSERESERYLQMGTFERRCRRNGRVTSEHNQPQSLAVDPRRCENGLETQLCGVLCPVMLLLKSVIDELVEAAVVFEPPIKDEKLPMVPEELKSGALSWESSSFFLSVFRLASSCCSLTLAAAAISLDFFSSSSFCCFVLEEKIGASISGDPRNSSLRMYAWQINIAISNSLTT